MFKSNGEKSMNNLRKLIRLLLKIPATPFVLFFIVFMIIGLAITLFFEWVYEAEEQDKAEIRRLMKTNIVIIKGWFTTI